MNILKTMLESLLVESIDVELNPQQESAIKKAVEAINKNSKVKLKLGKMLSSKTNRAGTTNYLDYELDSPDLGIFHHIISEVKLRVSIWDDESEPGRIGMSFGFSYQHHGRGSNGYDIGHVWVDKDGKIHRIQLTSDK